MSYRGKGRVNPCIHSLRAVGLKSDLNESQLFGDRNFKRIVADRNQRTPFYFLLLCSTRFIGSNVVFKTHCKKEANEAGGPLM